MPGGRGKSRSVDARRVFVRRGAGGTSPYRALQRAFNRNSPLFPAGPHRGAAGTSRRELGLRAGIEDPALGLFDHVTEGVQLTSPEGMQAFPLARARVAVAFADRHLVRGEGSTLGGDDLHSDRRLNVDVLLHQHGDHADRLLPGPVPLRRRNLCLWLFSLRRLPLCWRLGYRGSVLVDPDPVVSQLPSSARESVAIRVNVRHYPDPQRHQPGSSRTSPGCSAPAARS